MSHLFLFDIDGVLSDDTERLPHALRREWVDYFNPEAVWKDKPLEEGFRLLIDAYYEGEVQFLTGRRADLRWVTLAWLNYHFSDWTNESPFRPEDIIMRPFPDTYPKDARPVLAEFKEGIFRVLQKDHKYITLYDDDPEVCRHIKAKFGDSAAEHCTWYNKHPDRVHEAKA